VADHLADNRGMNTPVPTDCLDRLATLLTAPRRRAVLGLIGPPGAGKSTFAAALLAAWEARHPGTAQVVPMDGFHLANVELARLGRAARKGAPDTFDSAGFVALLRRLRDQPADEVVLAPEFRREIEEPVAGAIPVFPETRLVIVEGNYLLLDDPRLGAWGPVRALLDEAWYVDVDPALRLERLVARHVRFGRSPEAARAWVASTDEPNARLIEATRARADRVIAW
jgi:pantothenate kinase